MKLLVTFLLFTSILVAQNVAVSNIQNLSPPSAVLTQTLQTPLKMLPIDPAQKLQPNFIPLKPDIYYGRYLVNNALRQTLSMADPFLQPVTGLTYNGFGALDLIVPSLAPGFTVYSSK